MLCPAPSARPPAPSPSGPSPLCVYVLIALAGTITAALFVSGLHTTAAAVHNGDAAGGTRNGDLAPDRDQHKGSEAIADVTRIRENGR